MVRLELGKGGFVCYVQVHAFQKNLATVTDIFMLRFVWHNMASTLAICCIENTRRKCHLDSS